MANDQNTEASKSSPGPLRGSIYGTQILSDALPGLRFPADKQTVLAMAGDQEIEYEPGRRAALRPLIEEATQTRFDSMAEILSTVSLALDKRGATEFDGQKGTIHN